MKRYQSLLCYNYNSEKLFSCYNVNFAVRNMCVALKQNSGRGLMLANRTLGRTRTNIMKARLTGRNRFNRKIPWIIFSKQITAGNSMLISKLLMGQKMYLPCAKRKHFVSINWSQSRSSVTVNPQREPSQP